MPAPPVHLDQNLFGLLALSLGAAWASGINLYAVVLVLGVFGLADLMPLPSGFEVLESPLVLWTAGLLFLVEFVADKVPGVDSAWDVVHTVIRIPAGAILAAAAVWELDPAWTAAAALAGGGLAASSHFAKSGSRLWINTSPEPFSNIGVSLAEDLLVIGGLWIALAHPWVFLIFLGLFLVLVLWAFPVLLRGVGLLFGLLQRLVRRRRTGADENRRLPKS